MTTRKSPRAVRAPAMTAPESPSWGAARSSKRTGAEAVKERMRSRVPSVEPSSTKMISSGSGTQPRMRPRSGSIFSASFNVGMTSEIISGRSVAGRSKGGADHALRFLADPKINSTDVLAHDAEQKQLRAGKQQHRRHERSPAGGIFPEQMLEHHFDHGKKTKRTGDHAGEGHKAQWQDGEIHQHAQPKPRQLPERVAASALLAFHVPHARRAHVLRHLENQPVDIRIRIARLGDFIRDQAAHATEARQIKLSRFFHDEIRDEISERAASVAPPGVLFPFVD